MYCRICGSEEDVQFAGGNRGMLCPSCLKDTPRKVGFDTFCRAYFKGDDDCPVSIRHEFYDDYRASNCTLKQYIVKTIEAV